MKTVRTKILAMLMCIVMLLGMAPAAMADWTTLEVQFCGLIPQAGGQWQMQPLSGSFSVQQNGAEVGVLSADAEGSGTVKLNQASNVLLVPDAATMPAGYQIQETGYSVSITAGRLNTALVMVYADAGLFTLQATGACGFTLTDEQGVEALSFTTDEQGSYTLPQALPAGVYTVHQTEGDEFWPDFTLELTAYRGAAEQILPVDLLYAWNHMVIASIPEPTAVPTEEPTAEPTEAPTPEPTAVPTEEPTAEPTEAPTPEPTAVPTEEPAAKPTEVPTLEPTAVPTEEPTAEPTEAPTPEPTAVPTPVVVENPASLDVRIYHDKNGNGARNAYDMGVAGTLIEVIPAGATEPIASVVTDEDASPVIGGLPAGTYTVRVTLPLDMGYGKYGAEKNGPSSGSVMQSSLERVQVSPELTLAENEVRTIAVGAIQLSAVSGKAWDDVNGDGIMQEDEPGQEGVLVSLKGTNNGLVYEVTTGESGEYYIGQVKPGNYKMTVTTPQGTMFTKYSKTGGVNRSYYTTEGKRSDSRSFLLKEGQVFDNRHIGVVGDGSINVLCFLDANFNGLYDENEGLLAGVEVDVIKSNGKTVSGAVSGEDGIASAGSLRSGTYSVAAVIPEGYAFSRTAESGNGFQNNNGRRKDTVKGIGVTLGADTTIMLGAVVPASITGVAYLDDNFSGKQEKGEDVVSGLQVALLDENGEKLVVDRTTAKGQYVFEGLNPGTYSMRLEAKRGYAFTKLGEGNYFVNIGDGKGQTEPFVVAMGAQITGMDIGQILPGTVQGSVFADANDNGLQDAGETGFTGTVVRLMSEEGEHFAATIEGDGAFCFDAVMPGRYYLQYDFPGESTPAVVANGGNTISGEGNVGRGEWFDFAVGAEVNAPLCGGLLLGSVDGVAFADHNGSGVRDEGEETLSGVALVLTPARGDLESVTMTTGEDGSFAIKNLRPDTYTLQVTMPEGYVMSRVDSMTLPVAPGVNTQTVTLELAMGDRWSDQTMGGAKPASLSGIAWLDENVDGLYDEKEIKPNGKKVTVIDQHNGQVFAQVTIEKDGTFAAEGLIPGSYTLEYGPAVEGKTGDSTFTCEDGKMIMRNVVMVEGETRQGLMLGIVCHTSISGNVWVDMGGEIGAQAGAEISLSDAAGTVLATAVSDDEGAYAFTGLMPGQYQLAVTLPEGRVVVEPGDERLTAGENISVMTECNARSAKSDVIELRMSRDQRKMNIGAVLPGALGDLCWLDVNGNGLQDSEEGGIPGVRIELMRGETVVAETVSDQYGFYRFTDVYPASYTLRVTAPAEVKPTQMRTDFPAIASVLGEDGISVMVQVTSDKTNRNADLGFALVKKDAYPAGYGEGATQDWTKLKLDD